MVALFINYRRSDTEGYAGRLYDQLVRTFNPSDVFMDVDSIVAGQNFLDVLEQKLAKVDVMLVVIGSAWLEATDETGSRRLDQPNDLVRKEITAALSRDIAVIPVLVGAALMPNVRDLPNEISSLAHRQGVTLRHDCFAQDVQRLAEHIEKFAAEFLGKKNAVKEFEETIGHNFDSAFMTELSSEDLRLRLYFASNKSTPSYFASHLLTDAIVSLIEQADLSGWMKHEFELQPEDFWMKILRAVAATYRVEIPYSTEDISDADLLHQLISEGNETL